MNIDNPLKPFDIVARKPDLIVTELDNVKVMMHIESGKYYELDAISSHIWQLLETPHSVGEVISALLLEYDVEENQCMADLLRFFTKAAQEGLFVINSQLTMDGNQT